jgi:hypothetical protein
MVLLLAWERGDEPIGTGGGQGNRAKGPPEGVRRSKPSFGSPPLEKRQADPANAAKNPGNDIPRGRDRRLDFPARLIARRPGGGQNGSLPPRGGSPPYCSRPPHASEDPNMKCLSPTLLAFAVAACLGMPAFAGDNELTEAEKAAGWKLIFNGKDATGWVNREKETLANWEAKEGALTRVASGGDVVYAAEQFENFEFSIDWKTKGNSGVFVRMSSQKDWLNTGMEIQVLPGGNPGKHSAGSLYDLVAPPANATVKKDDWNNFTILCDGPIVSCKMNGVETFKIDLRDEMWQKPQGKFNKAYAALPRKGWIMLQDHGAEVAYKNIKVRPLPTSAN